MQDVDEMESTLVGFQVAASACHAARAAEEVLQKEKELEQEIASLPEVTRCLVTVYM